MAAPAAVGMLVKAALTLTDERIRKGMGWMIVGLLSPILLMIVLIVSLISATAAHNNNAIELCFHGGMITASVPLEYREYIKDMQSSFTLLDSVIKNLNGEMENESLDITRAKAIFFATYFGEDSPYRKDHRRFAECFVRREERTRTVGNSDGTTSEETYTVTVPITNLPEIYINLSEKMGIQVSLEDQANASEIYYRILYGRVIPSFGTGFDDWLDTLPLSDAPLASMDGFCSPLGKNWRSMVTSEFGWRSDPFTGEGRGHEGIDLGAVRGTKIRATLGGTVLLVRYSSSGYGYHLAIDHGGGLITLYAHCSKILVAEGQTVHAGDVIAEVGSTGRSTGNHLHFEVRINGEKQNPRNYLP
ncbi:MAG: M23 family metallopeptidase [Clostridia bacterium]|nr:M23 family metallopeptidase [Clostridia bacterium]